MEKRVTDLEINTARHQAANEERFRTIFHQLDELKKSYDAFSNKLIFALIGIIGAIIGSSAVISSIGHTPATVVASFWLACFGWTFMAMYLFYIALKTKKERSWCLLSAAILIAIVALLRSDMGCHGEANMVYTWWMRTAMIGAGVLVFINGINRRRKA